MTIRLILLAILLSPTAGWAAIESREFAEPGQESRYADLIGKLRCLVCQNQNLADSNAELARDLRDKTYGMIVSGKSDDEITDFMVSRYGDFVLYEPPLNINTLFLWLAPAILAGIGAGVFFNLVRRRKRNDGPEVDAGEIEKARSLLNSGDKKK